MPPLGSTCSEPNSIPVTDDRRRRTLLIAIAISLLIHLVVARFVRYPSASRGDKAERISVTEHRVVIVARATEKPQPRRTAGPAAVHSVAAPRNRSRHHARASPRSGRGRPIAKAGPSLAPPPSPSPAPVSTPRAAPTAAIACAHTQAPSSVVSSPAPPDIPPAVRAQNASGTAVVDVKLDTAGNVVDATVAQSSGNSGLDLAAVSMARAAAYAPQYIACKAVASDYLYRVKFVAW